MSVLIYKDNIVEKIGGQSQFDFVVITYCESIRDDYSLNSFFAHLELDGLIGLQKELLNAAFMDTSSQAAQATIVGLAVKYPLLWQQVMEETNFEQLKAHFVMALRSCWAEEAAVEMAEKHFDGLRLLFQQSINFVDKAAPSAQRPRAIRSFDRGVTNLAGIQRF
ncbi:unnamed protein product [Cylindrotheca closterium]|uniref:Uncharacterized protein n=1 Tax=Cylindrotheca closterium TaxID=2856 RepID=A0AAD2FHE9_9STRA|nr:unnamed protein product [Cylindrotheca closterium]